VSEHNVIDCETGEQTRVPFTAEEETLREADAAAAVEQAWAELRHERTLRLTATDWTQTVDDSPTLGEADREAWRAYRQQLRDLPAQTSDPLAPDWPTPPAAPGG
jgi:hypothetical protein